MKTSPSVIQAVLRLLLSTLFVATAALAVPSIPNPSFEANAAFATSPGTVALNAPITGWTANDPARVGLNPAGGLNFHADNGLVPNGTRVAFLQSDANNPAAISTTITGLTAGRHYKLQFRFNRKTGGVGSPTFACRINGVLVVTQTGFAGVNTPNVHTGPYFLATALFAATGATAPLEISNTTNGSSSLLLDHFTIVEAVPIQVTQAANDGPGSLRQALASAAATQDFNAITFAPALSGQTINLLTSIPVADARGVAIDASALPKGLTIDGGSDDFSIFAFNTSTFAHFRGLTMANGARALTAAGGATVTVSRCTLFGNGASGLPDCGAIENSASTVFLSQSTLAENTSAPSDGGAILADATARTFVDQCTITANIAGEGGGIHNSGLLTLTNSIVAENVSINSGDDIFNEAGGTLVRVGDNIIQDTQGSGAQSGTAATDVDPNLTGLADNGGPTLTNALLPASVARNASVNSPYTTDQRGRPVQVAHDLGAYDTQRGAFKFQTASQSTFENISTKSFNWSRVDGFEGAVSVKFSASPGTASAADFGVITNQTLNVGDAEANGNVVVTITNDALVEANETFTAFFSAPTGGATLGTPASVPVTIIDPSSGSAATDPVAPAAPVFTSPAANASVNLVDGQLTVTGTATDNKGLLFVQTRISLDGGAPTAFTNAQLQRSAATSSGWSKTFNIAGAPTNVLIEAQTQDQANNLSTIATRTVKLRHPLRVDIAGNGSVTPAGYAPSSFREIGSVHTLTAKPAAGHLFTSWSLSGATAAQIGVPAVALQRPTLTFMHANELKLTANFVPSPFTQLNLGGNYKGLVTAANATPSTNSNEGLFNATLTATGAFSGAIIIDGLTLAFSGAMDHTGAARFGTSRATTLRVPRAGKPSLLLQFHQINSPPFVPTMTGTLTAVDFRDETVGQSVITANRARYNGTTAIPPAALLGPGNASQVYNIVLPAEPPASQPAGFEERYYPQGTGFGRLTLTKAGVVTLTDCTLADGTTGVTASTFLDAADDAVLFIPLYNKKGFLRTKLAFDTSGAGTDVTGSGPGPLWLRPVIPTSHYYPDGWPEAIELTLRGSKYGVAAGQSVFVPDNGTPLDAPDADGNVQLQFQKGQLTGTLFKFINLSTADVVTKLPANNPTFTFSLTQATGLFSGTFVHTDTTTVAFKGILVQKPPSSGGFGFFLTKQPVPIDFNGESGSVALFEQ